MDDTSLAVIERVKRACGARLAIVLYRFSPSAIIRRIRDAGHEVARAPSGPIEIEALCYALLRPLEIRAPVEPRQGGVGEPPPRRFDAPALAALAQASTTVYCECPRHLVELVLSLGSFEQYSADCANRGPEDAALHRDLQRTAGHARALMEESLLRVAVAEGLPISKVV